MGQREGERERERQWDRERERESGVIKLGTNSLYIKIFLIKKIPMASKGLNRIQWDRERRKSGVYTVLCGGGH